MVGLQNYDPVVCVNVDSHRPPEPPFRLQICPPPSFDDIRIGVDVGLGPWRRLLGVTDQRRNILAVGGVDLDSVVPPVGYVYISI